MAAVALVTISPWTRALAAPAQPAAPPPSAPAPTNVTIGSVSPDANALDTADLVKAKIADAEAETADLKAYISAG